MARGVAVDPTALTPHNSYSPPDFVERGYYVDKPFVCQACGISQTWTAAQQKWWYEVAKGDVFSTATQCRAAGNERGAEGEPASEVAIRTRTRIRGSCSPRSAPRSNQSCCQPGTVPSAGTGVIRRTLFIDYSRSDDVFTLSWDQHQARLTAELLTTGGGRPEEIAVAEFSGVRSTSDIEARLAPFLAAVRSFLDGLREPEPESGQGMSRPHNAGDA